MTSHSKLFRKLYTYVLYNAISYYFEFLTPTYLHIRKETQYQRLKFSKYSTERPRYFCQMAHMHRSRREGRSGPWDEYAET